MVTNGRLFTDTIINIHKSTDLSELSCIADYLDECIEVPAEDVSSETFKLEVKSRIMSGVWQESFVESAEIIQKDFWERNYIFCIYRI